jgi:hypothetical protein
MKLQKSSLKKYSLQFIVYVRKNKTGNVRINVTLRHVCAATVVEEKQLILHNLRARL